MLETARNKAEKLVADLLIRQADLKKNPPTLPAEDLQAGHQAMQNAVNAAQRMLANLEDALRQASDQNR